MRSITIKAAGGRLAAAPHVEAAVEAAAERFGPAVDAARDRVVEDLIPRLAEAVHHAAVAGTSAAAVAGDTVPHGGGGGPLARRRDADRPGQGRPPPTTGARPVADAGRRRPRDDRDRGRPPGEGPAGRSLGGTGH